MIERDAVEIPPADLPTAPVSVRTYQARVGTLVVQGQVREVEVLERRDFADGRVAFRLMVWPPPQPGRVPRVAWFWGDPGAMAFRSFGTSPVEAPARPGDAERVRYGPPQGEDMVLPRIEPFRPDRRPVPVRVWAGGQWHQGRAFQRWTDPGGAVSVLVKVVFVEDGFPVDYWRHYHWDPAAITEDPQSTDRAH